MAQPPFQRVDIAQRVYAQQDTTPGTFPTMSASNAFLCEKLAANIGGMPIEFHARSFAGNMGNVFGKLGARLKSKFGYSVEFRGAGGASIAVPDYDAALTAIFPGQGGASGTGTPATSGTGSSKGTLASTTTTAGGGTSLATASTSGMPSGTVPGNPIMVETTAASGLYEMCWPISFVTNTSITLAQACTASANGSVIQSGIGYQTADFGHLACSHDVWLDSGAAGATSDHIEFISGLGSLKIDASKISQIPRLMFEFDNFAWNYVASGTKLALTGENSAGKPQVDIGSIVKINGVLTDIRGFTLDLGQTVGQKTSQNSTYGVFGEVVTQRMAKGTIQLWDAAGTNNIATWAAGTVQELTLQWGNTLYNTVGIRIPYMQITSIKYGADTGMLYDEVSFQCGITNGADDVYLGFG